jgi:hypothetical protein
MARWLFLHASFFTPPRWLPEAREFHRHMVQEEINLERTQLHGKEERCDWVVDLFAPRAPGC